MRRDYDVTEKSERITNAFRELRKKGYFARKNFWCCQSCAWAALSEEEAKKAVFYHKQDASRFHKVGEVHLAWSGNGQEIKTVLEHFGLVVEWDGSKNSRLLVK